MSQKRAFITGISGQDGPYLADLLLSQGYEVHGLVRKQVDSVVKRLDPKVIIHVAEYIYTPDVLDILKLVIPDEIYNLAAQSSVARSFTEPDLTWEVNYYAFGRLVESAIAINPSVKIYQASTSEMFGNSQPPQNENTQFNPQSPYAASKAQSHIDFVRSNREGRNVYIVSGFLFNHESPYRSEQYVTRKITSGFAKIEAGIQEFIELGNLNAVRDWGHAKDYVRAMHLMLQVEKPDDYVIASGYAHSIRDFVELAAEEIGMEIAWEGDGVNEVGRNVYDNKIVVKVNPGFYRPAEVNYVQGDYVKAKKELNWEPFCSFNMLVHEMMEFDRRLLKK